MGVGAWITRGRSCCRACGASWVDGVSVGDWVRGRAQTTDQVGRVRSSVGRSARRCSRSAVVKVPAARWMCQRSAAFSRIRWVSSVSISMRSRPGSARRSASSASVSRRRTRSAAASSRSGRMTAVSYPAGGSPSVANGNRSTGTCPSRRRSSVSSAAFPRSAIAPAVSAFENRTPPLRDKTTGSSVTERTAENPTPKRPTEAPVPPPGVARSLGCASAVCWSRRGLSRLAEARRVASDSTPSASSGVPVLATTRVLARNSYRTRPRVPARVAASAAFWASSITSRSTYPPSASSSSAFASSRNRTGAAAHPASTRSRIPALPNTSPVTGAV